MCHDMPCCNAARRPTWLPTWIHFTARPRDMCGADFTHTWERLLLLMSDSPCDSSSSGTLRFRARAVGCDTHTCHCLAGCCALRHCSLWDFTHVD
jgi:hypothetical protein